VTRAGHYPDRPMVDVTADDRVRTEEADAEASPHDPSTRRRRPDPRTALVVAAIAVGFALPLGGLLWNQGPPMEEGFMLVFPEIMLDGAVPNRDFLHLYGPGSLWVLAGVFAVFEPSLLAERLVGLAQQVALVLGVVALTRPWGRTVALWCGLISLIMVITPIGLTALAWVGAVALGLWAVVAGVRARVGAPGRRGDRLALLAGALAGASLLFRPDLVLALALAGGVLLWGMDRRRIGRLVLGGAIGVSPFLVHIAMAGFWPAFNGMVLDPVVHLRGGRRLPVPPSPTELEGFLQKASDIDPLRWPIPALATPAQITAWFFLLLASTAALVIVGAVLVRRRPEDLRARTLAVAAAFSLGLLPQAMQRADSTHLAWVGCVTMALLPVLAAEGLTRWRPGWSNRRRGLVAGGAVMAAILLVIPAFTARLYADAMGRAVGKRVFSYPIEHEGRTFYYGRADVPRALEPLLDEIAARAEPGERLFVGTSDLRWTPYNDSFIYFLLPDLVPATYYIELDPGVANAEGSGLAEDVASADWVILTSVWDDWDEPNEARVEGSDAPNAVLREQFCTVDTYDGLFELLERCP
jgi:hypothetical protein